MQASRFSALLNSYFLPAILCASVALNVALVFQMRGRARVASQPKVISVAVPINLTDGQGKTIRLEYDSQMPTVLYWFSPRCAWCERNFQNFRALAAQAAGRYRFFAVSAASPAELTAYAQKHSLGTPVYSMSRETAKTYGFQGTPTTAEFSPAGKLLHLWSGAYDETRFRDVQRAVGVILAAAVSTKKD